ncbi:MAG: hypothetical protein HRU19_12985 [Pseudobacteriovorax sp.]|nr:hypothetical protein [Pseudobacteriovorax sp.]
MGLNYRLYVEKLSEVKRLTSERDFLAGNDHISVSVSEPKGLALEIIRDDFGFTLEIEICFRIHKEANIRQCQGSVVDLVDKTLRSSESNAVLLFNSDVPLLVKSGETVVLSDNSTFWTEGNKKRIGIPHVVKKIIY